ncbi:MAG: amidohydrolase [Pseudomonadota bacterium]
MTADIIITNGRVLTMSDDMPRAEAVAVAGNRILAVGRRDDVEALRGPKTEIVNAEGCSVTPGLIESHVHLFIGAASLSALDLSGIDDGSRATTAIRNYAIAHGDDRLIYAVNGSYAMLGPSTDITRQHLDTIMPDRPLAIMDAGMHTVWANTLALEAAGILHGAEMPDGAEIVIGGDGTATGELREPAAFATVTALNHTGGRDAIGYTDGREPMPAPTEAERRNDRAVLLDGMAYCASKGITSVHNMDGNVYTLDLCQEIDEADGFLLRVQVPMHFTNRHAIDDLAVAEEMRRRFASDRVFSGRVKLFMDGVLEAWTALMREPYPDNPKARCGQALHDYDDWIELAIEADRRGLQIDVHAIGDEAIRRTLDGFAAARRANGARDSRHRIEHVEITHPDDFARIRDLGVIVSIQPSHAPGLVLPADFIRPRLRDAQLPYAWAWDAHRRVSRAMPFSSDWPVAPVDPLFSFRAGMTRQPLEPSLPSHRQTFLQMLAGYTRDAAFTEFAEDRKGQLKPGMLADIAVFSDDLEAMPGDEIDQAQAVLTICDGRITHCL